MKRVGTDMKAKDLFSRFSMESHLENGSFLERHYKSDTAGRADSGSIYYYVAPGEITKFHRIDCDEYWCHNAGSDIEIWSFTQDGTLKKHILGTSETAEPLAFFKSGEIFAARLSEESQDGAFITCITVPRFSYEGFEIIEYEKMAELFPESSGFGAPD